MKYLGLLFSFLAIPSLALLVSGCGGNSAPATTGGGQTTTIYVAGFAATPSGKAAEVWQIASGSSTPTMAALSMPGSEATASQTCGGIAVSGSDVYVAGWAWNAVDEVNYIATSWVNGAATALPLPSGVAGGDSEACGVVISGSNVYMAGNVPTTTSGTAGYWMNGAVTALPTPTGMPNSSADAIAVSGSNVYVAGSVGNYSDASPYLPAYWVNGTATVLPVPSGLAVAAVQAIAVSGSNVYMAGVGYDGAGNEYATYWANGTATTLTLPSNALAAVANTMAISGSDVYVAGAVLNGAGYTVATYWVNGAPTILPLPGNSTESVANGIVVSGSDVYVAGTAQNGAGEPIGDGQLVAAYWVNGAGTELPFPNTAYDSYGTGIAVTTQ
jgi:hypothetical protein